ncbi:PspC domain-containing protein [Kitasatospora sp. NPDC088391]|uniref:PspC domain-containing protein n=1 Tax=Kitasatospora sp. NPDC088391 TaxID=3364074 RepID=UPI0038129921
MTDDQIPADAPENPADPPRPVLTRSSRHRVVAGVCGGLGRYLDIDPVVFRVVLAVLGLTGGLGLFLYGLAWLVVPREAEDGEGGRTELQRVLTGRVDGQSVGAVVLTVIGTGVFLSSMGDGDQLFPLLLLAALVFLALRYDPERRRRINGGAVPPPEAEGGPYDRLDASGPFADWKSWGEAMSRDLRGEWKVRSAEFQERVAAWHGEQAARTAAGRTDAPDTPPVGPSGYLWDPRHPERDPYGATPPGAPAQPWWQRTDLPDGDPLRKQPPADGRAERAERHRQAHLEARERHRESMRRHHEWKAARKAERGSSVLGASALLVAAGAAWAVAASGHGQQRWSTVLAVALLPLGLAMLVSARWGRTRGLTFLSLLVTAGLVLAAGSPVTVADSVGDRSWTVAAADTPRERYALGFGDARLDLSAVDPRGGTVRTSLWLGAGDARVVVPSGVELRLKVRDGAGEVGLPDGQSFDGPLTDENVVIEVPDGQPSKGVLDLTVTVGAGNIEVVR